MFVRLFSFLFLIPLAFSFCLAQKTDLVILKNGDRLTGEIKKLDQDILQLKTSTMSTAQIKWYQVSTIIAPDKYCQIELRDKTLIFGNLDTIDIPNALRVTSEIGEFNVPVENVVSIFQVKQVFLSRFSGSLGAGVNYTKASKVMQTNYSGNINYKDKLNLATLDISSIKTDQPEKATTAKEDYFLNYNRTVFTRQFISVFGGAQTNTELDMGLRKIGGLGYGVDLIHNSISRLRVIGSSIFNQETTYEENLTTNNAEALISLDARIFKYRSPELYLNSSINYYPSITVPGRHRLELNFNIRLEIVSDLFIELKVYDNYDSKPASETAQTNDYGIISSLQYTFGL